MTLLDHTIDRRDNLTVGPSPEFKARVLQTLLDLRTKHGEVANRDVRDAATLLQVTPRTVRRWITRGEVPVHERKHWLPPQDWEALLKQHRTVGGVHRHLKAATDSTVSLRTMQRGFKEHTPTLTRVWARSGFDAVRGMLPTATMPDTELNEEWAFDDTQLPVWCVLPDGSIGKPHMEGILETSTRLIVGLTLSPWAFITEDAVENLVTAMTGWHTPNGTFVGGKPTRLRSDRGSTFVTRATSLGLLEVGVDRVHSEAYSPEQNGKIERWHRTLKSMLGHIPGFDDSDWLDNTDPRKPHEPPAGDVLLHFYELAAEVLERVFEYNTEHVHSAHGMTPVAAWEAAVTMFGDVERVDAQAARAAMRQEKRRKLNRRRIQWNGKFYALHPDSYLDTVNPSETRADEQAAQAAREERRRLISFAEGTEVTFRFLQARPEFVSVYDGHGRYLGDAVREDLQTIEQVGETVTARRLHIKTLRATLDDIAAMHAAGVEVRKAKAEEAKTFGDAADVYGPKPPTRTPARESATASAGAGRKTGAKGAVKKAQATARASTAERARQQERRAHNEWLAAQQAAKKTA